MMQVNLLAPPQHESVIGLLRELLAYYNEGAAVSREMVWEHLLVNLLGSGSPLQLVVAHQEGGEVLGFAAITLTYSLIEPSPALRRHCQLKELYVRSSQRSLGIGKALMAWIAQYAQDNGCGRIDWPVKANNTKGIDFYKGLGAQQVMERLSFRLSEPRLGILAANSNVS